jgi:hypothetical protein
VKKQCEYCHQEFSAKMSFAKFCSDKCRKASFYASQAVCKMKPNLYLCSRKVLNHALRCMNLASEARDRKWDEGRLTLHLVDSGHLPACLY